MKTLILLLTLAGCGGVESEKQMREVYWSSAYGAVYVVGVDGCEYVLYRYNGAAITHKANCKNKEHQPLK